MRSLPIRSRGGPLFHIASPCLRYDAVTVALRLSSPSISHSNPSETSVAGSVMKSFAVVLSAADNGTLLNTKEMTTPVIRFRTWHPCWGTDFNGETVLHGVT